MCKADAGAMQLYWERRTIHQYSQTVINNAKETLNITISARTEVCSVQTKISQYCIGAHRMIMQSCWVACESCFLSYKQHTLIYFIHF